MTAQTNAPRPATHQTETPTHHRHWTRLAGWAAVAAATIFALTQCAVLVRRAGRGKTDFSVIYRTARAINRGEGGDLYARPADPSWPRCIPPVGTAGFQLLALMPPRTAAIVWCAVTLAVLAAGAACLARAINALGPDATDYRHALPSGVAVLVLLAADCLQTGQFSILFVACWLAFIPAAMHRRDALAGVALALPAAVKFYPALLLAVPLALRRASSGSSRSSRSKKAVLAFAIAWIALTAIVPLCILGPARAWDLSAGYVRHNFLADANVVNARFHAATVSNQAIDVVLLRYLTSDGEFHAPAAAASASASAQKVPHLDLPRPAVLALAQIVRVIVFALAALATWRYARSPARSAPRAALILTALWAATLYLILPETKARYAVYTAPAYLPILAAAASAARRRAYLRLAAWLALTVTSLVTLIALPAVLLRLGLGLTGPVILFVANLTLLNHAPAAARRPRDLRLASSRPDDR